MVTTRRFAPGAFTPTPVVLATLVLLVAVYVVAGLWSRIAQSDVTALVFMDADAVCKGELWRLLSYGLLHSLLDPMHLVWNGLVLFMFGRDLERAWGGKKLVAFFAVSVVVGGLFVVGARLTHLGTGYAVGFSAACQACVVAWALMNRDRDLYLFFAVPAKGIHMLVLAVGMWVLDAVSASQSSAAAHLGGMLVGALAVWLSRRHNALRLFWDTLLIKLSLRKQPKLTIVPKGNDRWVN